MGLDTAFATNSCTYLFPIAMSYQSPLPCSKLLRLVFPFVNRIIHCNRAGRAGSIWASRIRSVEAPGAGGRTKYALKEATCCKASVNADSGR